LRLISRDNLVILESSIART